MTRSDRSKGQRPGTTAEQHARRDGETTCVPCAWFLRKRQRAREPSAQKGTKTPCNGQAQAARSQCQHQAKQRVANKKASCQPGGFGSPAANGYTRQPCRSHPSPPSTQASYGRSLFPNECLQAGAATSKQHSDEGLRKSSRPFGRRVTVKLRRPEAQWQRQAKQRITAAKASCQPGGFGSPAANGYAR